MKGIDNPLTADRVLSYQGGDAPHYSVDQLEAIDASVLLKSNENVGRMFVNETTDYKVISSSVIMAAIANGSGLNLKPYLISEIVNYFIGYNPVTGLQANIQNVLGMQNYPNPLTSSTTIDYRISSSGKVIFDIYSNTGQLVRSWHEWNEAGVHKTIWDSRNDAGRSVPSGSYILQLTSSGQKLSKQIIVIR